MSLPALTEQSPLSAVELQHGGSTGGVANLVSFAEAVPQVSYSAEAVARLSSDEALAGAVRCILERLPRDFAGDCFEVAVDRDHEAASDGRTTIGVVTQKTPEVVAELLQRFDEWWLDHGGPGDVDVWVRHV